MLLRQRDNILTRHYVFLCLSRLVFCLSCYEGYFSNKDGDCTTCPEHCMICDSTERCSLCADGYWGIICELPCSRCLPGTSCEKTNGYCFEKCKYGYTGILCDAVCNDKCLNCDRMNAGICDMCAFGRYGESCDERCSEFCYNNTCNINGYCTYGCVSGYWGSKCKNNCSSNCKQSSCDTKTGACTNGCNSNFIGNRCDTLNTNMGVDVSLNNDEEIYVKTSNDGNEGQPTGDDTSGKENEANREDGKLWIVIVIAVAVLIVGVAMTAVYLIICRKKLTIFKRRGRSQQGDPEAPTEEALLQRTKMTTSDDSGVCCLESPLPSLKQDTEVFASHIKVDPPGHLNIRFVNDFNGTKTYIICRGEPEAPTEEALLQRTKMTTSDDSGVCSLESPPPSLKQDTEVFASHIKVDPPGHLNIRFVNDFNGTKTYIICRDPINNSSEALEFWALVWQENCSVIVKLSRNVEETPDKIYWPDKNKTNMYGAISVTSEGFLYLDKYRQRTFEVKTTSSETRKVIQMQFLEWPRDRLLWNEKILLEFRQKVEGFRARDKPILVHCSDGHTRSEVYVAVDMLLNELEKQDQSCTENYKDKLQSQGLIATKEHFDFLRRTEKSWRPFKAEQQSKDKLKVDVKPF